MTWPPGGIGDGAQRAPSGACAPTGFPPTRAGRWIMQGLLCPSRSSPFVSVARPRWDWGCHGSIVRMRRAAAQGADVRFRGQWALFAGGAGRRWGVPVGSRFRGNDVAAGGNWRRGATRPVRRLRADWIPAYAVRARGLRQPPSGETLHTAAGQLRQESSRRRFRAAPLTSRVATSFPRRREPTLCPNVIPA